MNKKTIEVKNGSMSRKIEVDEGTTIGQIKEKLGTRFSLSGDHSAFVNSPGAQAVAANDNTPVEDGQTISFMRTTGQKG